jgi:hypothetical protein
MGWGRAMAQEVQALRERLRRAMTLMLGQPYDALRAGSVPDDRARAAAEEVANYEGELSMLRLEMSERFSHVESEQRCTAG